MQCKQILAATDFSPAGDLASERAALLAQQHDATLHLLHVLPTISWAMFGRALVEHPLITEKHLYQAARERLVNLGTAYQERYGITVQVHVDIGRPYQRIADYVATHAIDLSVLGPHAENLARDLFVGSTARKFLHKGTHPALIAQSPATGAYRRVLVAVDFSESSQQAVELAAAIAPDAPLHVLHIYDVMFEGKMRYAGVEQEVIQKYRDAAGEEAWRMMHEFISELPQRERVVPAVQHGQPARAILDEAQALQADLIVMGKRGGFELDTLFLGSVTESILHGIDRDLLLAAQ